MRNGRLDLELGARITLLHIGVGTWSVCVGLKYFVTFASEINCTILVSQVRKESLVEAARGYPYESVCIRYSLAEPLVSNVINPERSIA